MAIRRDFWPHDEDQSAFMQSVGLQLESMSREQSGATSTSMPRTTSRSGS